MDFVFSTETLPPIMCQSGTTNIHKSYKLDQNTSMPWNKAITIFGDSLHCLSVIQGTSVLLGHNSTVHLTWLQVGQDKTMNTHLRRGPERLLEPAKVQAWKDEKLQMHRQVSTILKGDICLPRINPPALPDYDHDMSYSYLDWFNLQVRMERQDPSLKKSRTFGPAIFK